MHPSPARVSLRVSDDLATKDSFKAAESLRADVLEIYKDPSADGLVLVQIKTGWVWAKVTYCVQGGVRISNAWI